MGRVTVISAAVEGIVDEAVVRKLIAYVGATPGEVLDADGACGNLITIVGELSEAGRSSARSPTQSLRARRLRRS